MEKELNLNVFFLSYGIYEYDGRLRELIKIAKKLGKTQYITQALSQDMKQEEKHYIINNKGILGYLKFILYSIFKGVKMEKIDILFVDNRKAIIPALIIKLIKKPKYIIQDVRELYVLNEVKHVVGKIGCVFEKKFIKKADIIICANNHRAEIMKNYYGLHLYPLVYENIRSLEYLGKFTKKELEERYGHYFKNTTVKIVSTSGCSINRTNDKLVSAMIDLGERFELFLIGGGSKKDIYEIKKIIDENKLDNIYLIDKLETEELKYFLGNCHIGVVNYHKKDMNNKYCASGKIYEYLFEGLPVVTTENVPLVEMCNNYKIGIADDNYVEAIKEVAKRYSYYTENVKKYINNLSVEENNLKLIEEIKSLIKNNVEGC